MNRSTITKTAWANMKKNRNRNILTGIAIALTSILIAAVLSTGYGVVKIEFAAVNNLYANFHTLYQHVTKDNADKLKYHADIEQLGVREDMGIIFKEDIKIGLLYMDDMALKLGRQKLESGKYPTKKDEIVVTQGMLEGLGINGKIGSKIALTYQPIIDGKYKIEQTAEFVISGFAPTEKISADKKMYVTYISEEFLNEVIPKEQQEYGVMIRFRDASSMTKNEIEEKAKKIAKDFGIKEQNVVMNTEYLAANYVDPSVYMGVLGIIIIIMLAGALTIYSIYYVSMIDKVQEYGKLKALGASKHQIKQMVFREGIFISGIAIPIGIFIGVLCTKVTLIVLTNSIGDDTLQAEIKKIAASGEVSIIHPVILILAVLVTLCTVVISLIKPMAIASRISPVEAIRYNGEFNGNKKYRKGYSSINLYNLTWSNLSRNKKKTMITIFTMGATGVLFIVVATALTCSSPKEVATKQIYGDFQLSVVTYSGDEMHPEKEWSVVQQNNPLNSQMEKRIASIEGVHEIRKIETMEGELNQDDKDGFSIDGIPKNEAETLKKGYVEGSPSYNDLLKGDRVVFNKRYLLWYPDWKVGDKIKVKLFNGYEEIEKSLEIAAIGDYHPAFSSAMFIVPIEVTKALGDYNLVMSYDIVAGKNSQEKVKKELEAIAEESNETFELNSYEKIYEEWEMNMKLMSQVCYSFMTILGIVGILNLVNTMIYSIYTRRRELGMLQTIGMSEHQLLKMLQMEGMFYTFGTLIISLGFGTIFGYLFYLYAKNNGVLSISSYHYPTIQSILLIIIIVVIQFILTFLVNCNYHKQSLMDRIRAVE